MSNQQPSDPFADQPAQPPAGTNTDVTGNPTLDEQEDAVDQRGLSVGAKFGILAGSLALIGGVFALIMSSESTSAEKNGKGTTGLAKRPEANLTDVPQFTDFMSRQVKAIEKDNKEKTASLEQANKALADLQQRLTALEMSQGSGGDDDSFRRQLILAASPLVRSLIPESTQYLAELARERGLFSKEETKPLLATWITARRGGQALSMTDLDQLFDIACVRREPLHDAQVAALPRLQRQAETDKIELRESVVIARWIWGYRARQELVPASTPGQMLAMGHNLTQMASGLPVSSRPSVATGNTTPAEASSSVVRPVRQVFLATRRVREEDLPRVLFAAAALRPVDSRTDAARTGAFLARLGEVVPALVDQPVVTLDRALDRTGLIAAVPEAYISGLPSVPGAPASESVRASGTLAGLAGATQRAGLTPNARIAECLARVSWDGLGDKARPIRASQVLSRAAGAVVPDLRGLPVDLLETAVPAVTEEVLRRDLVPALLIPAFTTQAALAGVGAVVDAAGDQEGAIRQAVYRAAAVTLASAGASTQVQGQATSRYAILFAASARNWSATGLEASGAAERAIAEAVAEGGRPIEVSGIADLSRQLQRVGQSAGEQVLAMAAVGDHVGAEISKFDGRCAPGLLREVRTWADRQIQSQVIPPFEVDRLAAIGTNLARDCVDMLSGRKRIPRTSGNKVSATGPTSLAPIGVHRSEAAFKEATAQYRHLSIPSGSYGTARIFSGVVCALGQTQPEEMLINLDYYWQGPNRTRLRMRDLRIIGMATAMGGPARVKIKLDKMSYVFPSKREWSCTVRGWAVDNLQGMSGVPGNWELNVGEVLPVVAAQGLMAFIQGVATPKEQVVINNSYTTTLASDTSSSARLGAAEAMKSLTTTTSNFADRILAQVGPSISVPNNQPLTCVLYDSVDIAIPVDEWSQVVEVVSDTTAAVGFAHAE